MPAETDLTFDSRVLGDLYDTAAWWHEMAGDAPAEINGNISVISNRSAELAVCANSLCATLTNNDAANVTTLESNDLGELDYENWMSTCEATRDLLYVWRQQRADPEQLHELIPEMLREVVDAIVSCAKADSPPALLDGPVVAAAALLAYEISPDCLTRIRPLTLGASEVETVAWEYLRIKPVLPIRTRIDGSELAPIAVALMNVAVRTSRADSNQQTEA